MRTWPAVLGLVTFFCVAGFGRPKVATSGGMTDDDFRRVEQKWLDAAAVPDLPELRKLFADDFMGTAFGTKVLTKSDVIPPDGEASNHLPKSVLQESTVRTYGDTAVLMGAVSEVGKTTGGLRVTTVFRKRGGDWQIIAIHMSPVPAELAQ